MFYKKGFSNSPGVQSDFSIYLSITYLEMFWFWQNRQDWTFNFKTKLLQMVVPCGS